MQSKFVCDVCLAEKNVVDRIRLDRNLGVLKFWMKICKFCFIDYLILRRKDLTATNEVEELENILYYH